MSPRTLVLLSLLTLSAGYADAVAFFGLGTFTANMTGNTVLLGADIARFLLPGLAWPRVDLGLPALSIACFVAGGVAAAIVLRRQARRQTRRFAVLAADAVLVVVSAYVYHRYGAAGSHACVALLSLVMGMQSVVAVRAGVDGVSTVYITGSIVAGIIDLAGARRADRAVPALGSFNLATWLLYLGGATCGTVALRVLTQDALWPVAIAIALLLPFAL